MSHRGKDSTMNNLYSCPLLTLRYGYASEAIYATNADEYMFYTLLVDADASFRKALADVLLVYFPLIDVEDVGAETEAMSKMECLRPSIVFMDTQLPSGNGLEILKKIRQMYSDMVIVVLTANNLSGYRQQAFENGVDHYISKKEDSCMEEILTVIEKALDNRMT
jgi:DNA-binding NarL/FixJ family response regulator